MNDSDKALQEILPLIEKPSRYIGNEINSIKKYHSDSLLKIALAFPDLYEIGTSHFGMQILYNILNKREDTAAERVFAPAPDFAEYLKKSGTSLMTLESKKPLKDFDIIGFSLLYELNYTNMLSMLELSGIPFLAAERDEFFPILIAGGPCMANPEPVADFFDAIVIGDGEEVIVKLTDIFSDYKKNGKKDKKELLLRWANIEGVYIPSFEYGDNKVLRAIVSDLNDAPFPEKPIIPFAKPVHDRLRLEIARGCAHGCRFCQAGMIYRPVRERDLSKLIDVCEKSITATGYDDISLLSLSSGDYTCILQLIKTLMTHKKLEHTAFSMPSLRADSLTKEIMTYIKKVRKTGFTIAPEAGSQRLRDVINKKITYEDIELAVLNAASLGWRSIKLYFMIGLPTETDEDIIQIIELVNKLKKRVRGCNLNVSISAFVPKPHTPFQWTSQISLSESKNKLDFLKKNLTAHGVSLKWQDPEVSRIEGVFARGDRKLSHLLVKAFENGCVFDGWTDKFAITAWNKSFEQTGINPDFYTTRERDLKEPLSWDHIDIRVKKEFLIKEWEKALSQETTQNCVSGKCELCGVCDFENIKNRKAAFNVSEASLSDLNCSPLSALIEGGTKEEPKEYKKYALLFSKKGNAKYIGHLEMIKIFMRALSRADIPIKFSEGFHPMPKIAFKDTLPVGIESEAEYIYLQIESHMKPDIIIASLNKQLPEGFYIKDCFFKNFFKKNVDENEYKITSCKVFDNEKILFFDSCKEMIIETDASKGKIKKIDLKKAVKKIELKNENELYVVIVPFEEKIVRPFLILKNIFDFSDNDVKLARIVKV